LGSQREIIRSQLVTGRAWRPDEYDRWCGRCAIAATQTSFQAGKHKSFL
jgi:hypothetical protein